MDVGGNGAAREEVTEGDRKGPLLNLAVPRRPYFTTRNERWVAPGVSSVRMRSNWIGEAPK